MHRNGIDLDLWRQLTDGVAEEPEAARVTLRTRHHWDGGFAVDGQAEEIEASGEVVGRSFSFRTDWPADVGGGDTGPTPGEAVLAALGGCVGMTYIANATKRGIEIDELVIAIEAQADLRGLFDGVYVRPGFQSIEIELKVRSDADHDVLAELARMTAAFSTIYDSLASPVPIGVSLQRMS